MKHKIFAAAALLLMPVILSASAVLELKLGKSVITHNIDGKLDAEELKNGFRLQGATSEVTKAWSKRQVTFYLARTDKELVIFATSPLPPAGLKLQTTDENVFTVTSPAGKTLQIKCNPAGFVSLPAEIKAKSLFADGMWSIEAAIPASLFGIDSYSGNNWKIQLERLYRNQNEKTFLADNGAKISFADAPFVDFYLGKAAEIDGSWPTLYWQISNPQDKARKLDFTMESSWDGAPRALALKHETPAGAKHSFIFTMNDFWQGERRSVFAVLRDNGTEFFRYNGFFGGQGLFYLDSTRSFDIGIYPSLGKAKARIFSNDTRVTNKIASVDFTITDKDNSELARQTVKLSRSGFYKVFDLPSDMKDGFYKLNAILTMKDGKTETLSRDFEYRKFDWLGNQTGLERDIIIPPFKPLVCDKEKQSVHALLTGYRIGGDIFNEVYADGENILSAPVTLFINSKKVTFGKAEFTETAQDRVQAVAKAENLPDWQIHYDFDYDGLVWITLQYTGKTPVTVENISMEMPLAEKYAKLFQACCGYIRRNPSGYIPSGSGTVWNSLRNAPSNFMAYIWMGETEKGLAWFHESLSNWKVSKGTAHHEIIRRNGQVILKNTIVNTPLELAPQSKYEMGFQASPVKPQMKNFRKYQLVNDVAGWTAPRSVATGLLSSCMMWSGSGANTAVSVYSAWEPWNRDYSFVRYLKTLRNSDESRDDIGLFIKNFVDRNVPQSAKKILTTHMRHGALVQAANSDLTMFYFNPRSASFDQPEFRVFEDEWNNRTFRTGRDGWYSFNPFASYRDFMAVKIKELARNGMDGVYFDNSYEAGHTDPVMGDCQEFIPGTWQNQFTFMDLRRLVKRTAAILYKEGKLIEGRPFIMVHVTNSSILPVMSFASNHIDWEIFFGKKEFQERFSDGYIRAASLGTQSGTRPTVIFNTKGGDRKRLLETALAVTFGYDLPDFLLHGEPEAWFKDVVARTRYLGYTADNAIVYSGYSEKDNPVKVISGKAKITVVKHAEHALLLVGDFGSNGNVTVDLSKLGTYTCAVDAMNGKTLGNGNKLNFAIARHGFKIIILAKDQTAATAVYNKMLADLKRPTVRPVVKNIEITESIVRGKRTFSYLPEKALTGKAQEKTADIDGKKVFKLKKDHGLTFPLPDDYSGLAGKSLEISYRFKIKGMPANTSTAQGFKVMLVHSNNGKNTYGHTLPAVTDNSEWKRAVFGAKLGANFDGGSLRINAPAEEIILESIIIKVLD
ncbi:MAG: hypothetical protein IJC27_08915 [Lentisphaeria bacterium]|nr:hypothetical protein [Lentisphaeria bacterium]